MTAERWQLSGYNDRKKVTGYRGHMKHDATHIKRHKTPVTFPMLPLPCHLSPVTRHLSPVTRHLLAVMFHLSPVTCCLRYAQQVEILSMAIFNPLDSLKYCHMTLFRWVKKKFYQGLVIFQVWQKITHFFGLALFVGLCNTFIIKGVLSADYIQFC